LSDTKNKFNSNYGYNLEVDTAKISIDFDTNVGNPINTILGHNGSQFILVNKNLLDSTNTTLTNDLSGDDGNRKGTVKTYVFEKLVDPSIVGCANCNSGTDVYNDLIMTGQLPIINREIIAEFEIEPEAYHSIEIDLVGHRRVGVDGSRVRTTGTKSYDNCIGGGIAHTIALKGGKVLAWGSNSFGQCTIPTAADSGVTAVATGCQTQHTIALKDGAVLAWGDNSSGQCTIPAAAQSGVLAITGGSGITVALKNTGEVLAWGFNFFGQTNVPASANSGVSAIAAGGAHVVAIKNGAVLGWGRNNDGQITIPSNAQSGVTAIACGQSHTVALKNGTVLAWGRNTEGQCNVPLAAQSGVTAIACGYLHTIALKDGKVLAWGLNDSGQCIIPTAAQSGVVAIAGGAEHTIALRDEGVLAWGKNAEGQTTVPTAATSGIFTSTFTTSVGSYNSYINSATPKAVTTPSDLHIGGNATTGFEPYRSLTPDILKSNHPFLDYSCCPCCDAIESGDPAAVTICNNSSQYFITPATTYYNYCAVTTRKYLDSDKNTIENITQCELLKRNKNKYGSLPNTTLPNCNSI